MFNFHPFQIPADNRTDPENPNVINTRSNDVEDVVSLRLNIVEAHTSETPPAGDVTTRQP
jgi:hypothetical protein